MSTEYCKVALRSFEYNSGADAYGYIAVNGKTYLDVRWSSEFCKGCKGKSGTYRGINIMEFNMVTCSASQWKWFDTHGSEYYHTCPGCSGGTGQLIDYLTQQVSNGSVLLGISIDDPMNNLTDAIDVLLDAGIDVRGMPYQSMFAFVMQEGFKHKTVLKKSPPHKNPIELYVKITEASEWK